MIPWRLMTDEPSRTNGLSGSWQIGLWQMALVSFWILYTHFCHSPSMLCLSVILDTKFNLLTVSSTRRFIGVFAIFANLALWSAAGAYHAKPALKVKRCTCLVTSSLWSKLRQTHLAWNVDGLHKRFQLSSVPLSTRSSCQVCVCTNFL